MCVFCIFWSLNCVLALKPSLVRLGIGVHDMIVAEQYLIHGSAASSMRLLEALLISVNTGALS